jgi:hypothetical protein
MKTLLATRSVQIPAGGEFVAVVALQRVVVVVAVVVA